MVLGPSISIDDWVPELPPKKKQLGQQQQQQQQTLAQMKRGPPSPDLPPPPPMIEDDQMFVSDEPLPPPPPEAIWPKPESLKNDKYLRNGKEKRLENSFSAVEDVLSCREHVLDDGVPSYHGNRHRHKHDVMSEKSKSLSYIFDNQKAVPQTPRIKSSFPAELLPLSMTADSPTAANNGADDKQNGGGVVVVVKELFGRSSSVRRNKLTIPNKEYCKSEFSARKSVFQGGSVPKQVVMSTVKPPAFSATTTTVQKNAVRHQICTPLKIARDADKKAVAAAAAARSPSVVKTVVVAGPLKTSGAFPPSLEPNCPPTLYQQ